MRQSNSERLLTRRDSFSHWISDRIRFSDTDMVGHVNNVSFATYCETGRSYFMRDLTPAGDESRILIVVAKLTLSFLGEVHWPGNIDIGSGILSLGRTSALMGQGLFVGDRCVGCAESVMVMIDETSRKPREIGGWVREGFSRYLIGQEA